MNQNATSPTEKVEAMGIHRVTPHLVCAGAAKAIDFYKEAFGATEMMRLPGPDGKLMHAAVMINGSSVMLVDEFPQMGALAPTTLKGTPVTIHLMVDDVDAFTATAIAAGATVVMPVADQFWGDRYGVIADPFGHHWSIATPGKEQPSMDEIKERMAGMSAECGPGPGAQPK
jgi:PhnB protein